MRPDERTTQGPAAAAVGAAEKDVSTGDDIVVAEDDIEEFAEKAEGWWEELTEAVAVLPVEGDGELEAVDWKAEAWKPEAGDGDDGMAPAWGVHSVVDVDS